MFVGTWNVAGGLPPTSIDLKDWLGIPCIYKNPDIIVIGLQEFCPLNLASAISGPEEKRLATWKIILGTQLNSGYTKYTLFQSLVMMGLCFFVYGKKEIIESANNFASTKIKTGFMGTMANKGAAVIRFNIGKTSMCLLNCHLASGKGNMGQRFDDMRVILSERVGTYNINSHELKIFFGDLNFRVDMEEKEAMARSYRRDFEPLKARDQLLINKGFHKCLSYFNEAPINFNPTYKFEKGTTNYSLKHRVPAWCDRILFSLSDQIQCTAYGSVESITFSDHKPVFGTFNVQYEKIVKMSSPKKASTLSEEIKDTGKKLKEMKLPTQNYDLHQAAVPSIPAPHYSQYSAAPTSSVYTAPSYSPTVPPVRSSTISSVRPSDPQNPKLGLPKSCVMTKLIDD